MGASRQKPRRAGARVIEPTCGMGMTAYKIPRCLPLMSPDVYSVF